MVYPIDLVKTRFQTQLITPDVQQKYTSLTNALVKIHKHEGFIGLYRGLSVNVLLVTPELVVQITGNDCFRHLFQPPKGEDNMYWQGMAAACTGVLATLITSPMELFKIQLQNEGLKLKETNNISTKHSLTARIVLRKIIKENGILGIFKGVVPCALRDIPFAVIYFPLFAFLYDKGPKSSNDEATSSWSLFSGIMSGAASAFLLTPADVVKTRIQTLNSGVQYDGVVDCFKKIYRNEGFFSFFRGAGCRVLVIAPLFGFTEMIYYFGVAETLFNLPTQTFVRHK